MAKKVAIVGAGPSGIAAARQFLIDGFNVSLFEKSDRVGGLWAVRPGEKHLALNPEMPTNLTSFSVSLGDLAWNSVNLGVDGQAPMYPKAWQVGRYLEKYRQRHLPGGNIHLGSRVTIARWLDGGWSLTWLDATGEHEAEYDYLVVASGFFAGPRAFSVKDISAHVKFIHSSRLRQIDDVLPNDWNGAGNLVVVGGSISGAEAASLLALGLSNRRHRPGGRPEGDAKIYHIFSKPFYAVPPWIRTGDADCNFIPAEIKTYEISTRPEGPVKVSSGLDMDASLIEKRHTAFKSIVGDQSDLSPALSGQDPSKPPRLVSSPGGIYTECVRQGLIIPVPGRLTALKDGPRARAHVAVADADDLVLEDIIGGIYANGYAPDLALDYLDDKVKTLIEYDKDAVRLPVMLRELQTFNDAVPSLGFVGFYEGPFWGVAERQSQLLSRRWSGHPVPKDEGELDKMRQLRAAMAERNPKIPQFWLGDYVGSMLKAAEDLGLTRTDTAWGNERKGPVIPARYMEQRDEAARKEANIAMTSIQNVVERANAGAFIGNAAFRAMQGVWKLKRRLDSKLAAYPSGDFDGTATFSPRFPTDAQYEAEYLYREQGMFYPDTPGFGPMSASRSYVWRIHAATGKLSSWFAKPDNSVDYLFFAVAPRASTTDANTAEATTVHECSPDTYHASLQWTFDKVHLAGMTVEYKVTGPKKDYVSVAHFSR